LEKIAVDKKRVPAVKLDSLKNRGKPWRKGEQEMRFAQNVFDRACMHRVFPVGIGISQKAFISGAVSVF